MACFDFNQPSVSVVEDGDVTVSNSDCETTKPRHQDFIVAQLRSTSSPYSTPRHVLFYLVLGTTKYTLTTFDVDHNHELDRIEYKHLSKVERKLTYVEHLFIIKVVNPNSSVVRAHNLYIRLKGSFSLVHGTETEFKNFTRGVNCFIGDSHAQILITRMEDRQQYIKDFSFDYFVENAELYEMFWANEVAK
ncbi:hypothetical protein Tco_1174611 [Tanacetum coccineum]